MMGSTRRVSVFAYAQPCDMRKSFDSLAALVQQALGKDLLSGDIFLFVGKDRKRAKALHWDGTGLCLYSKRLEQGRFAAVWQRAQQGQPVVLTVTELALFLEGSELVGRTPLSPPPHELGPCFTPREMQQVA